MDIEDFPKFDDVRKAIERIKENGFPQYSTGTDVHEFVKKIENILSKEFGLLFNPVKPLKHEQFKLKIFRAREIKPNTNYSLIREHSYPPIDIARINRCNFPKFPVFYGSDNALTALIEVARNNRGDNNKYYISKWEILDPEETLIFETFLQSKLPDVNHYRAFQKEINEKVKEPIEKELQKKLDIEREKGLIEYLSFIDNSFIDDNDYSLSATLAHRSLYAEHNFRTDILMYPSIQTMRKGVNLAIQPNFVENFLRLKRLYKVSLNNYDREKGTVNITIHRYGIVEKSVIMWKNIDPNDSSYKEMVVGDFGEMNETNFNETDNLP